MPAIVSKAGETKKSPLEAVIANVYTAESRLSELASVFSNASANPLNSPDFKSFLLNFYSELAMRYVLDGKVPLVRYEELSPEDKERLLSEAGFTISGNAASQKPNESGIDPALLASPAARAAMDAGLDLTGLSDDD